MIDVFLVVFLCIAFYVWGMFTIRNHILPYDLVRSAAQLFRRTLQSLMTGASATKATKTLNRNIGVYDILFVGDSLTYGYDWQARFPHLSIYNASMMGETTKGALRYIKSVAELRAKRAFIMLGAKDFESVGYRCATAADLDETMENFRVIVTTIMSNDTEVVILAALQVNRRLRGEYPNPHLRKLNRRLATYALEIGVPFIDLNEFLSDNEAGLSDRYTYDGIKLEESAYHIWADTISQYL